MSHIAAVIPEAKAPLEVQETKTELPGPRELLVKNELIALQPIDAKVAKLALLPLSYPSILGTSYGGTVIAAGEEVSDFKIGDKVAVAKSPCTIGDKYSAFQRLIIARPVTCTKLPKNIDLNIPVSLIGNLGTVVGLFNVSAGLERPNPSGRIASRGIRVLVYGGTSSFGSLAVQYVTQAGYDVVTTTSPNHEAFVSKLGATKVINHRHTREILVQALTAEGPYDLVVDSISTPQTVEITAAVLSKQGGGNLYTLQPAFGPEHLPKGVTRKFASWSVSLDEDWNEDLLRWTFNTYLRQRVAEGDLMTLPTQKISGGLSGLNAAFETVLGGVSGVKIVVDPQYW